MWYVAVRGLQRRGRRTVLGVLSIALVVTMFIVIQSISDSFVRGFFSHIYSTEADVWVSPSTSFSGMGGSFLGADVIERVRSAEGVLSAEPGIVASNRVTRQGVKAEAAVVGYQPDGIYAEVELLEGRMPDPGASVLEAVIDESVRARLGDLDVGDTVVVSGSEVEVVGLSRNRRMIAAAVVLMPIERARGLLGVAAGESSIVLVTADDGVSPESVRASIASGLGDDFRVLTKAENVAEWERQMAYIQRVLSGVSALAFLIGALVMTIIVYISVVERTRELGVLKALGATDGAVRSLVLLEAVSIAVPGFALGSALGVSVATLIPRAIPIQPVLPPALFAAAALITGVVAVLGSAIGAHRAVRVDPIVALRTV